MSETILITTVGLLLGLLRLERGEFGAEFPV